MIEKNMTDNIKSDFGYNLGGITSIYLLDKDSFLGVEFEDDKLYDRFTVKKIYRTADYIELDVVDESLVSQTFTNDVYKIELKSFVRVVRAEIIHSLEFAKTKRFVVIFKTIQGQHFIFGTDGGVQLSYTLQTDAVQGVNGINIAIQKNSIYPLFEIQEDAILDIPSSFIPDFENAYCVSTDFQPQFDKQSYCMLYDYRPQFNSFICQTNQTNLK